MRLMQRNQTNNPLFTKKLEGKFSFLTQEESMTLSGTINKSFFLLFLVILSAFFIWTTPNVVSIGLMGGSGLLGFGLAIATSFMPSRASFLAPLYAITEGVFLGCLSFLVNTKYPGIPVNAVILTFLVFAIMLSLYRFRIIRVTEKFRSIMVTAMLALASFYLLSFLGSWIFGMIPFYSGASNISIGFSLIVIGLAAFSLLLDFDFIEKMSQRQAPKYMEWYASFGLLVTLIWLYVEILNLLMKLNSRD